MNILRRAALLLLVLPALAEGQDDPLKKFVTQYATDQAQSMLAKKSFKIDQPTFSGAIAPVEPAKTIKVIIQDLKLNNDRLSVKTTLKSCYELNGMLKVGSSAEKVTIRLTLDLDVEGHATLYSKQGKFFLKPMLVNMDIKAIRIDTLAPEGLHVDQEQLEKSLKDEFKKIKPKIVEYLNGALPEQQIK